MLWPWAVGLPMGIESLVGTAAGGAFAGSTSAEVLKILLGLTLIAAALKAFWVSHKAMRVATTVA